MTTTDIVTPRTALVAVRESGTAAGAAALSVLGSMVAIAIVGAGLLVVPIAAALAFGPALLEMF